MSMKTVGISVVIGAAFQGAGAFMTSQTAVNKLGSSIEKLNERRTKSFNFLKIKSFCNLIVFQAHRLQQA